MRLSTRVLFASLILATGCRTAKLDLTKKDSTTHSTGNDIKIESSGTLGFDLRTGKSSDYSLNEGKIKEPVVLKFNGHDTLVYIYRDSVVVQYKTKDSTIIHLVKTFDRLTINSRYDIFTRYSVTEKKKETTSAGIPWYLIILVCVGCLLILFFPGIKTFIIGFYGKAKALIKGSKE